MRVPAIPPLLSASRLRARVRAMGREIRRDYARKPLSIVGVLNGSFVFMADLIREVGLHPVTVDFIKVSSYGSGTVSSGKVRVDLDVSRPLRGKHVLLVEDIVDTGLTAAKVLRSLRARGPASLRLCALLHKPSRERVKVPIDYLGFTVPDRFVVGYGLDADGFHRNLPYIGVLGRDPRGGGGYNPMVRSAPGGAR